MYVVSLALSVELYEPHEDPSVDFSQVPVGDVVVSVTRSDPVYPRLVNCVFFSVNRLKSDAGCSDSPTCLTLTLPIEVLTTIACTFAIFLFFNPSGVSGWRYINPDRYLSCEET